MRQGCLRQYDANGNNRIDPDELGNAIIDYTNGVIDGDEMGILILLFVG